MPPDTSGEPASPAVERTLPPRFGIPGRSRYAKRLRKELRDAASAPLEQPVLIYGEPGLQKDKMAESLHFQSKATKGTPLIHVDARSVHADAGRLIEALKTLSSSGGTLVLNNASHVRSEHTLLLTAWMRSGLVVDERRGDSFDASGIRLIATASSKVDWLTRAAKDVGQEVLSIKVPPLRIRTQDIPAIAQYILRREFLNSGKKVPRLTDDCKRVLEDYNYPNNLRELETLVLRAVAQGQTSVETELRDEGMLLTPELFWPSSWQVELNRRRFDLFKIFPKLLSFARSEVWTEKINYNFVRPAFAITVLALIFGPQDRDHNPFLNVRPVLPLLLLLLCSLLPKCDSTNVACVGLLARRSFGIIGGQACFYCTLS